ncbi:MAG TPA: peptidoglycan editing factor PgeF [Steroidobacteraceae bacterium]|jgi:YfiH family protein|nr:peptidoglycan editing factor PgeF [Steroidobacteraceae bacterium]
MTAPWFEADWPAPPGVHALSTVRGGTGSGVSQGRYSHFNLGDHVGDDPAAVAANRRRLRVEAKLPAEPAWLSQVHGTAVADLDATGFKDPADAVIARGAGKVCAILTADCLPVVMAADTGEVVAAAHAGWRGLAAGVLEATVRALGAPPERLLAWLGPAIGPEHFEVGAEVRDAFLRSDPAAGAAFRPNTNGRFMADLGVLTRRRLEELGLTRIYGGGQCTFAQAERYFSYRRDGTTGRQATLIWREG